MEKNERPSSIDELFKDYKGSEQVEDVDWVRVLQRDYS